MLRVVVCVVWLASLNFKLSHQCGHALLDERFDLGFGHICEIKPQHIACERGYRREESKEENQVEDAYDIKCQ
jgi:hypothetical protein